jgi:hypothetical protein
MLNINPLAYGYIAKLYIQETRAEDARKYFRRGTEIFKNKNPNERPNSVEQAHRFFGQANQYAKGYRVRKDPRDYIARKQWERDNRITRRELKDAERKEYRINVG